MMKLSFAQYKGGSGKSTASLQFASTAAHFHNMRTVVLDLDVQGSATSWQSRRATDGPKVVASTIERLESDLRAVETQADLSIMDTPGHDWGAIATTAVLADLTVLVGRPTQFDFELAAHVAKALRDFRVPYVVLITQAPHKNSAKLEAWARAYGGLGRLAPVMLTNLHAFQDAVTMGLGVDELDAQGRAALEVRAALAWILVQLRGDRP